MTIDYNDLLTVEQKREILTNRMSQIAAEAYQVSLNSKTAIEVGAADQAEKIEENLKLLNAAIEVHQRELALLPAVEIPAT